MPPALPLSSDQPVVWIDRAGMWLSAACAVHCLSSAVLVAALSSVGGAFLDPRIHEYGLMLAIALGAVALGYGFFRHGRVVPSMIGAAGLATMAIGLMLPHGGWETVATLVGVGILAFGHHRNQTALS